MPEQECVGVRLKAQVIAQAPLLSFVNLIQSYVTPVGREIQQRCIVVALRDFARKTEETSYICVECITLQTRWLSS